MGAIRYFLALIVVFWIPLTCFPQEGWRFWNYSLGFGRIGIMQNSQSERSVFNPFIQFDLSYSNSLFRTLGVRSTLAHRSSWVYTRANFQRNNGSIILIPQEDYKLNTYFRSSTLILGAGPQLKLYEHLGNAIYLSALYLLNYHYDHFLQHKVQGDSKTYGENLNNTIHPLRHIVQFELNIIRSGSKVKGFFNCFTLFGGMDFQGYASDGKFRPVTLGMSIGI